MGKIKFRLLVTTIAIAAAAPLSAFAQTANPPPASTSQVPQPQNGGVDWNGVGIGAATLGANVLYIPAKFVYGILGGITGGAGWAVTGGNTQVSNTIWRSSLGGDYVLTPGMIRGDDPIHFSGPTTTAGGNTTSVAPGNTSSSGSTTGGYSASAPSSVTASSSSAPATSSSAPMSVVPSNSSASAQPAQPIDNGAGPVRGAAASPAHDKDFE
ncbi:MAG TPA: hypothetical protein VMB26_03525 [Candidatus Binataceae bacterium]|nr:hypothetical protein [Candidatus Binataceae bacterium]